MNSISANSVLLLRSVTFVSDRSLSPAVDPSFQYCNSMNDSTLNQSIHNTTERKLQTFRGLKQTVPHLLSKSLMSLHVSSVVNQSLIKSIDYNRIGK